MQSKFKGKHFRYSVYAAAMIVLAIVIALVLNAVVSRLSDRYNWSADLSDNKLYGLSEQTQTILNGLDRQVRIHVLTDETALATSNEYMAQLYQTLQAYGAYPHVEVDYVDLTLQPTFAKQYPDLTLSDNEVIVESEERVQLLELTQMLQTTTSLNESSYTTSTTISGSVAEQKLTNAVMFVTAQKLVTVSVLTGFSDRDPAGIKQLLTDNSFQVKQQSLITDEIDPEADIAVLYGLQRDISEPVLQKLDTWLDNDGQQGKTFLIFADESAPQLQTVDAFLREWGIEAGSGLAVEQENSKYYFYPYYPVAQFGESEYAERFAQRNNPIVMPFTKPVYSCATTGNYQVTPLLTFSDSASVLDADGAVTQTETAISAIQLSCHTNYGTQTNRSYLVYSGSWQAFSASILTDSTFLNAEYLLNLLNSLTNRENVVDIVTKDFSEPAHALTSQQVTTRIIVFAAVLPLCILCAGLLVFLRRRSG